jgi:hypothetical protein
MNEVAQTVRPFKILGTNAQLTALGKALAEVKPAHPQPKTLAQMLVELRQANQLEERVWFAVALCATASLLVTVWLW